MLSPRKKVRVDESFISSFQDALLESIQNDQTTIASAESVAHISSLFSIDITTPCSLSITKPTAFVCVRKAISATIRTEMGLE